MEAASNVCGLTGENLQGKFSCFKMTGGHLKTGNEGGSRNHETPVTRQMDGKGAIECETNPVRPENGLKNKCTKGYVYEQSVQFFSGSFLIA
jgi:hypothetical protein